jgi:energy-converting hydrogenase Eha subunit B
MRTVFIAVLLVCAHARACAQPAYTDSLGQWDRALTVYVDSATAGTVYDFGGQSVTIVADTVTIGCADLGGHVFTVRQFAERARNVALGRDTSFVPFMERYECIDVLRPLWQHRSGTQ